MKDREKEVMHVLAMHKLEWVLDNTADLIVDIPGHGVVIAQLLERAGFDLRMISFIIRGPREYNLANGELGRGESGLLDLYGGYGVRIAAKIALRRARGDRRVEIGMKYPTFNKLAFNDAFKPIPLGQATRRTMTYSSWSDRTGNVWTFAPGQEGDGGYAGFIAKNQTEAWKWLRFLLRNPEHYIKDLNVGYNTLGGLGIEDWDKIQREKAQ
jgi:hypothetical protein